MSDTVRGQLERAYELIQNEQLDSAISILRGVVSKYPNNGDAWWLLANAVTEPADAHEALTSVLRINPGHTEAREALVQLESEFPEFANRPAAPGRPADDDFGSGIGVDIDELLRSTGPLAEKRQSDPLKKPEGAPDASDAYLDALWATRQKNEAAPTSQVDLDSLFGGRDSMDVPATPTEDKDLEALFGLPPAEPKPRKQTGQLKGQQTPSPKDDGLDDLLFGGESVAADDLHEEDLAAAFAGGPAKAPDEDLDLDALFTEPQKPAAPEKRGAKKADPMEAAFSDPFEARTPDFVAQLDEVPAPRARRRREAKPAPVKVVADEPSLPDPLEAERAANRRSPLRRFLLLAALLAVILVGVLLALNNTATAPGTGGSDRVAVALQAARDSLTSKNFTDVNTEQVGDGVVVRLCSTSGLALQNKVYEAMDLIADQLTSVRDAVKSAQIEISACGRADVLLYRAVAPIDAVISYIDGGKQNAKTYRASWQRR